jgi:hypothetical protein
MADDIKVPSGAAPEPGYAVTSTTDVVPHAADGTSAPGPYRNLPVERPPVSTTKPNVPIAHSLTAGAGGHS